MDRIDNRVGNFFSGKPEYEIMQTAWRERNPGARIKAAKEAIGLNPECATAYILLAEEEVSADIVVNCDGLQKQMQDKDIENGTK